MSLAYFGVAYSETELLLILERGSGLKNYHFFFLLILWTLHGRSKFQELHYIGEKKHYIDARCLRNQQQLHAYQIIFLIDVWGKINLISCPQLTFKGNNSLVY